MSALLSTSQKLHVLFLQQIDLIKQEQTTDLKQSEKIISICLGYLKQLRGLVKESRSLTKADEIHFFKVIKPQFVSKYILHVKIFKLHSFWPMGNEQIQLSYLHQALFKINQFFEKNKHFCSYYRSDSTYLDHAYFLRNQPGVEPSLYQYLIEADPIFNTPGDIMVALVVANNQLQEYIEKLLVQLDKNKNQTAETDTLPSLIWTESKSAITELIYALHVCRVFNEGNTDIKTIAAVFSKTFHTDLKNIYDACLHIKMRKTELTKFLNKLTNGLMKELSDQE